MSRPITKSHPSSRSGRAEGSLVTESIPHDSPNFPITKNSFYIARAPPISVCLVLLLIGCATAGRKSSAAFDVRQFGATGNGATKDTAAFQKALDNAGAHKGGLVVVPAGNYLIGSVVIPSGVTLRFEQGATITGSPDKADYPVRTIRWEGVWRDGHRALFFAEKGKNITLTGPGKIVGNFPLGHLRNPRGPCLLEFIECNNVRIDGLNIEYERMWAIHPTYCTDVWISNLTIRSKLDNGDGIDVDSCERVRIDHCDIDTGDDAIALKSGRGEAAAKIARPTQDVRICDCTLGSKFAGLAIGTEMSGGIRNVHFERCRFTHGSNSIFIKSRTGRGGFMEEIHGVDLVAEASCFLRLDLTTKGITGSDPIPGEAGIPHVANLSFTNVKSTSPVLIDARRIAPQKPVENLSVTNVTGTCKKPIALANIKGVELANIDVAGARPITITNVTGTGLEGATQVPPDPNPPTQPTQPAARPGP